jgi:acyl-CoA thioesterase-2
VTVAAPAPSDALRHLLARLDLTAVGPDLFLDPGAAEPLHRIFGGQVAAQAVVAMGRTVEPGRGVHSLHVSFLRPARCGPPLQLHVRRVKQDGSWQVREVDVSQDGRDVLTASAAFAVDASGCAPVPDEPRVHALPPRWEEQFAEYRHRLSAVWTGPRPVDIRFVDPPMLDPDLSRRPRSRLQTLVRSDGPLPGDPLLHAAVLVYASDTTLLETALLPAGQVFADGGVEAASLDHAMWFHRPPRADRWLRFDQEAVTMSGGRGLATGRMVDEDGDVVATVMQEGLLRPTGGRGSWLARSATDPMMRGQR